MMPTDTSMSKAAVSPQSVIRGMGPLLSNRLLKRTFRCPYRPRQFGRAERRKTPGEPQPGGLPRSARFHSAKGFLDNASQKGEPLRGDTVSLSRDAASARAT